MSKLVEHAKNEFEILGWPGNCEMQKWVCDNIIGLLKTFSSQGHSGYTAPYVINIFNKLANFETISPLTGEDDEWETSFDYDGIQQNKRDSRVFKRPDGTAYFIEGKIFIKPDGTSYTSRDSSVDITFPYISKTEFVHVDWTPEELEEMKK